MLWEGESGGAGKSLLKMTRGHMVYGRSHQWCGPVTCREERQTPERMAQGCQNLRAETVQSEAADLLCSGLREQRDTPT